MPTDFKKKVTNLRRDLEREIASLENELRSKKDLLATLSRVEGGRGRRRGPIRKHATAAKRGRKGTGRRSSKNRDMIVEAASKMRGQFTLAQLREKIQEKHPKFGGKYPSSTIITTLKTTPEVRKVKRGYYKFKG
jgi:hypothetical protein